MDARDVAPWITALARAGFVAKAVLYATIGAFAAVAAFRIGGGGAGGATDTRGAMATLHEAPGGSVLLVAMALGLLGYALWRIVEGAFDPEERGTGAKALALRASFIARGLAHLVLAFSAASLALRGRSGDAGSRGSADSGGGPGGAGDGQNEERAARAAMDLPGGEWILWAVAIGVAAYGAYQLYRAFAADFGGRMDTGRLSRETGRWVIGVCRFGVAARGVVFLAIGWMVLKAAREHDPDEAGGLSEALRVIEGFGRWPFAAIAAGLIAYGGYQLVNARYRDVRAGVNTR